MWLEGMGGTKNVVVLQEAVLAIRLKCSTAKLSASFTGLYTCMHLSGLCRGMRSSVNSRHFADITRIDFDKELLCNANRQI